jgi:hypothetical protein
VVLQLSGGGLETQVEQLLLSLTEFFNETLVVESVQLCGCKFL